MPDIGSASFSETDASNNSASPNGAPEGMPASGVNDTIRAVMGAMKRWYSQIIPATTGGTSTAYTVTYTVAPSALTDGMSHLVYFNATSGAAPTLNFNSLGAKAIHVQAVAGTWAAPATGALLSGSLHRVTYHLSTDAYRVSSSAFPVGVIAAANNLSDLASVITARSNLKVDSRTAVADTSPTVGATDYMIAYTSISTARTVTLPAASTFNAGRRLVIIDESGSVSATNTISLVPNGTDTIAGSNTTQVIINIPRGKCEVESNGTNGWFVIGEWSVVYTAYLGANVSMNNTANYFDGPSVAQGTVGTWKAAAGAPINDSAGAAQFFGKLWDGTTTLAGGETSTSAAGRTTTFSLAGQISAPAGNIKLSVRDASSTGGTIGYNQTGTSKDAWILVWRVA